MTSRSPGDATAPTPPATTSATPAEPMSFIVHATPPAARDLADAQTPRGRRTMFAILLACTLPVIASYVTYFYIRPAGRTNYATLIEPQQPLPGPELVPAQDLQGNPLALTRLKGQWLIVAVAPAACDASCERHLFMQRQVREMLGAERDRVDKVWLVDSDGSISPDLLAAVQARPGMHVLRVERAALARWLQPESGHALEDHFYIVDPLGHWMMRAPADPDPMRLKKDVERLLRASEWWDRPGDADRQQRGPATAEAAREGVGPGNAASREARP